MLTRTLTRFLTLTLTLTRFLTLTLTLTLTLVGKAGLSGKDKDVSSLVKRLDAAQTELYHLQEQTLTLNLTLNLTLTLTLTLTLLRSL